MVKVYEAPMTRVLTKLFAVLGSVHFTPDSYREWMQNYE